MPVGGGGSCGRTTTGGGVLTVLALCGCLGVVGVVVGGACVALGFGFCLDTEKSALAADGRISAAAAIDQTSFMLHLPSRTVPQVFHPACNATQVRCGIAQITRGASPTFLGQANNSAESARLDQPLRHSTLPEIGITIYLHSELEVNLPCHLLHVLATCMSARWLPA